MAAPPGFPLRQSVSAFAPVAFWATLEATRKERVHPARGDAWEAGAWNRGDSRAMLPGCRVERAGGDLARLDPREEIRGRCAVGDLRYRPSSCLVSPRGRRALRSHRSDRRIGEARTRSGSGGISRARSQASCPRFFPRPRQEEREGSARYVAWTRNRSFSRSMSFVWILHTRDSERFVSCPISRIGSSSQYFR